jgi:hypothetical protein
MLDLMDKCAELTSLKLIRGKLHLIEVKIAKTLAWIPAGGL